MDDGRRGIDWIIPVRVEGENKFVGLCGQDKNRVYDNLEQLVGIANTETHHKVTPAYFLSGPEKDLFQKADWSLGRPAILLSIHAKDAGASLNSVATVETRCKSTVDRYPCIVLTSLGYKTIMDENVAAEQALGEL
jgi:hypothetical protein